MRRGVVESPHVNESPNNPHERLYRALADFSSFKAVLVGDFMLDQQIRGAAERMSPEAPVPVLTARSHRDITSMPGGASNVAACLSALGAEVHLVGVSGADQEGGELRSRLAESGCHVDGLIEDKTRPTTVKRSLVGLAQHRHPQKMFRLDFESREPLNEEVEAQVLAAFDSALDDASVVCIEDYDKGVCTPEVCRRVIDMARSRGIPVLVDPAGREDSGRYAGASIVTPNRTEAELVTRLEPPVDGGIDHGFKLAEAYLESCHADAVVVTLDRDGAILKQRSDSPLHLPTRARSVYDVTGAGDMVLAALAAGVANNLSLDDSVRLSNVAAGLEVETFGVRPIPIPELRHALLIESGCVAGAVRSLDELLLELEVHRANGRKIILTNGCFDVLHAGHVAYLREAKQCGDILVVGVNTDRQVASLKGPGRPIFNEHERLEMLGELRCVDSLVLFDELTAHDLIRAVSPEIYVKGGDYEPQQIVEHDVLVELGIEIQVLAHRPGICSTSVIDRIRSES
jgi:D-beta-D-heptose 7-phosphate kinase/D-beta-D-heptose 1-phosphate adenosyltransferase